MKNNIIKIIKNIEGTLLGIGLEEETYLEAINKNKKILECNLLNSIDLDDDQTSKKRNKKISPNKLRKYFKHKKINYLIVNYKELTKIERTFIKDSIYITNKKIYIYFETEESKEEIIKKYNRYKTIIKEINPNILEIDVSNAKNNFIKDTYYLIIDYIVQIADAVSDLLAS